jgi:hypothetical protein
MSGKTDQIKGRIKEAAGVLTDNDHLCATPNALSPSIVTAPSSVPTTH